MTGIAIIGQGYMGQTHAAAYTAAGRGADIRYVYTPRPAPPFQAAPDAELVTDLGVILDDPSVSVVSVCTPTTTHREIAVPLLKAGKNVLLEKPIALSLEDALAIKEAADASPGVLMVAQVVRFFEGHRVLRSDVASGRLGRILSARARRLINRPDWAKWWHDESKSGGAIVDPAVHDFDQMNLYLGRPVAVTSTAVTSYGPFETTIEYADGGIGQVLSHADLPRVPPSRRGSASSARPGSPTTSCRRRPPRTRARAPTRGWTDTGSRAPTVGTPSTSLETIRTHARRPTSSAVPSRARRRPRVVLGRLCARSRSHSPRVIRSAVAGGSRSTAW